MELSKIGKFIAAERKARGMTQGQLAEQLHVSDKTVSRWETGKGLPEVSTMPALCEALGISLSELLTGERLDRIHSPAATEQTILSLLKARMGQRKRQILAAALTAVLTLVLMFALYQAEFSVPISSTRNLEAAIDQYHLPDTEQGVEVLKMEPVGRWLFVLFKSSKEENLWGLARLERGIFGKYRFLSCSTSDWPLYWVSPQNMGGRHYLILAGRRDLPGVASVRLFESQPDETEGKLLFQSETGPAPFLTITETAESVPISLFGLRYYDAEGKEIDARKLLGQHTESGNGGAGTGTAETFLIYAYELILLGLGVILIRYFLEDKREA